MALVICLMPDAARAHLGGGVNTGRRGLPGPGQPKATLS